MPHTRPIRARRSAAAALLLTALTACADDAPFEVIEDTAFASSLGIDLTMYTKLADGVYIFDETVGGPDLLSAGAIAEVDHVGWLSNGTQFSTGVFQFQAGGSGVISGFSSGTLGMRVGGIRRIIIPPALAYGSNPPPGSGIPVGAILVFEVELLGIS